MYRLADVQITPIFLLKRIGKYVALPPLVLLRTGLDDDEQLAVRREEVPLRRFEGRAVLPPGESGAGGAGGEALQHGGLARGDELV